MTTTVVLIEVANERRRQDERWGEQNHPDGTGGEDAWEEALLTREETQLAADNGSLTWSHILAEEVAEAFAETDPAKLREELLQVAAVAVCWIEAIDRRTEPSEE